MTSLKHDSASKTHRTFLFLRTLVLLSSCMYVLWKYNFEPSSPLNALIPVIFSAFVIHFWLPARFGKYFLVAATFAGSYFLLGILNSAALFLIILGFTLIYRLSAGIRVKLFLSLLYVAILFLLRMGLVHVPQIGYAIPVAGSLLMFRGALVYYEHKYNKTKPAFLDDLSFLFLLPNLALPLFPVLDYKTCLRNYDPSGNAAIQKGMQRICLGTVQLLLYRFIYDFALPVPSSIHSAWPAFLSLILNYSGILHFTGLLWLGVGFTGLFGFELPDIFNNVFLVESFGDIWRRINTYWREYVMKLVYYPVYFAIRKKMKNPVLVAVMIAFVFTALLHGWQWFWLLGSFTFSWNGVIYWAILGACIAFALSREAKRENSNTPSDRRIVFRILRIALMYLFMCVTWTIWNSSSLHECLHFYSHFTEGNPNEWLDIAGVVILVLFAVMLGLRFGEMNKKNIPVQNFLNGLMYVPVLIAIIGSMPFIYGKLSFPMAYKLETFSSPYLNTDDQAAATENYYNRMLGSDGKSRSPWQVFTAPEMAKSGLDEACTSRNDLVVRELIPSKTTAVSNWTIVTNSFGMRDKEYPLEKPKGTYRIAILGGSYEMGSGVTQDSVFDNLLEKMFSDSIHDKKIEVLNFAVGGYHLPQQVWVMQKKVEQFHPDLVLCFVHPADAERTADYMANMVMHGADMVYPELYSITSMAGAKQWMSMNELRNRFQPFEDDITEWSLAEIGLSANEIHARCDVVYLPSLVDNKDDSLRYRKMVSTYPDNFVVLENVFGTNKDMFRLPADNTHPNARGHLAIAKALFDRYYSVVLTE